MRRFLKVRVVLPGIYLLVAFCVWLDFMGLSADGFANLGLMLVVLPITLLDLVLRSSKHPADSIFVPDRWGYYLDLSVFFWISVAIIAVALFLLGRLIDRRFAARTAV
ncbi:MAG: hypothetical protein ACJ8FS_04615 [Sphingomicrobium sp.]